MQPDRRVADCTTEVIADAAGTTFTPTWRTLRGLEQRSPQIAHPDVDATLEIQFWRTTYAAAEAAEGERSTHHERCAS